MPYINPAQREVLRPISERAPYSAGELNYQITKLCLGYLGPGGNYRRYNEVVGVLECAKLELYRRAVAKYEDSVIERNGDVY